MRHLLGFGALALTACSADVQDSTAQTDQPIVRAAAEGGKDQVVLLYMKTFTGGTRSCTGTYIGPRLVLTAAHCMSNVPQNQVYAYFGSDFATDLAALPQNPFSLIIPPPGQASPFAQSDSYQVHPDWDASLTYPDMAVVYLDRALPFEPLEVARFRVDRDFVGKTGTLVGWGASAALSADISQTTGGRVQRTGFTKILGSPTQADYHPEDPNAGMLVPGIRRDTLKTDGHAPYANSCAGDSGGPLFVKQRGRDYVAGVGSWTGLWCEDYSLFTRIDPFLSFIDGAERRTGRAPVKPHLECVAPNSDGSYSAFFGYENENGVSVDVPYGFRNAMPLDTDKHRVSHFAPGRHDFVFSVDFQPKQQLLYTLLPEGSRPSVLLANKRSPACGEEVAAQVACGGFCRAGLKAGCTDALPSDAQCMSDCNDLASAFPECGAELNAMNQCYASTPPGEDHWMCNGDDFMPSSFDCMDQETAFYYLSRLLEPHGYGVTARVESS
ncbi:MAG: trypsin-like serine protease [Polyangiaceae bacterium]